jgi:DNA-binding transcriptional regulator YiaG
MPNLASVLTAEIRRLARKEIRAEVSALKARVAQHRREIAELKRQLNAQTKALGSLQSQRQGRQDVVHESLDAAADARRFSPRSVRTHRKRLNLSAEDYAMLVGVSMQTIYHWEQGKSRPRKSQLAGLAAVRSFGKREAQSRLESLKS